MGQPAAMTFIKAFLKGDDLSCYSVKDVTSDELELIDLDPSPKCIEFLNNLESVIDLANKFKTANKIFAFSHMIAFAVKRSGSPDDYKQLMFEMLKITLFKKDSLLWALTTQSLGEYLEISFLDEERNVVLSCQNFDYHTEYTKTHNIRIQDAGLEFFTRDTTENGTYKPLVIRVRFKLWLPKDPELDPKDPEYLDPKDPEYLDPKDPEYLDYVYSRLDLSKLITPLFENGNCPFKEVKTTSDCNFLAMMVLVYKNLHDYINAFLQLEDSNNRSLSILKKDYGHNVRSLCVFEWWFRLIISSQPFSDSISMHRHQKATTTVENEKTDNDQAIDAIKNQLDKFCSRLIKFEKYHKNLPDSKGLISHDDISFREFATDNLPECKNFTEYYPVLAKSRRLTSEEINKLIQKTSLFHGLNDKMARGHKVNVMTCIEVALACLYRNPCYYVSYFFFPIYPIEIDFIIKIIDDVCKIRLLQKNTPEEEYYYIHSNEVTAGSFFTSNPKGKSLFLSTINIYSSYSPEKILQNEVLRMRLNMFGELDLKIYELERQYELMRQTDKEKLKHIIEEVKNLKRDFRDKYFDEVLSLRKLDLINSFFAYGKGVGEGLWSLFEITITELVKYPNKPCSTKIMLLLINYLSNKCDIYLDEFKNEIYDQLDECKNEMDDQYLLNILHGLIDLYDSSSILNYICKHGEPELLEFLLDFYNRLKDEISPHWAEKFKKMIKKTLEKFPIMLQNLLQETDMPISTAKITLLIQKIPGFVNLDVAVSLIEKLYDKILISEYGEKIISFVKNLDKNIFSRLVEKYSSLIKLEEINGQINFKEFYELYNIMVVLFQKGLVMPDIQEEQQSVYSMINLSVFPPSASHTFIKMPIRDYLDQNPKPGIAPKKLKKIYKIYDEREKNIQDHSSQSLQHSG